MTIAAIMVVCAPELAAFLFISSGVFIFWRGDHHDFGWLGHLLLGRIEFRIFRKAALRRLNAL